MFVHNTLSLYDLQKFKLMLGEVVLGQFLQSLPCKRLSKSFSAAFSTFFNTFFNSIVKGNYGPLVPFGCSPEYKSFED